jgi:hypothetical protein
MTHKNRICAPLLVAGRPTEAIRDSDRKDDCFQLDCHGGRLHEKHAAASLELVPQ